MSFLLGYLLTSLLTGESIFITGRYNVSGELLMRNLPCSKYKSFTLFR
ncbi:hypothetical protein HMPREF6745_0117 [Prevotella sp. oral taxon 472 str. F0295]|nr:hypothetical protein HMPREF6745_0117 [Prevotella sp. oral taxon 472 str. F0295]